MIKYIIFSIKLNFVIKNMFYLISQSIVIWLLSKNFHCSLDHMNWSYELVQSYQLVHMTWNKFTTTPAGSACWNQHMSPQTCINIEGHHILYLTSPNWIYVFTLNFFICACKYILFCNLHMWINTIFSHPDIAGSVRVSLVVGVHSQSEYWNICY